MTAAEAAISYAERGIPVVRLYGIRDGACTCREGSACDNPGKHPIGEEWQKRATADPEFVRGLWKTNPAANVGLRLDGLGWAVLDADTDEAVERVRMLIAPGGPLADAPVATTRRGLHVYVATDAPPGLVAPGLELKSLMVVAPGSVNPDGSVREWLPGRSLNGHVPDLPAELRPKPKVRGTDDAGALIPEGGRNAALASLAGSMRRRGMTAAEMEAALQVTNRERCQPPLTEAEVAAIAASIARYASGDPPEEDPVHAQTKSSDRVDLRLKRIDVAGVMRRPPPPVRWIVRGFIEFGEIVNLQGYGKAGKSLTAMAVGIAAISGRPFLDIPVTALDWLVYVDAENPEKTIMRRLHRLGVPERIAEAFHLYAARGLDLSSDAGRRELDAMIPKDGMGLVVLDSAVAMHRADENAAPEVRAVVSGIRAIVETRDASAIILQHKNRQGTLRGSLDWRNAVDGTIDLDADVDGVRTLKTIERRDGDEDQEVRFRFKSIPHLGDRQVPRLDLEFIGGKLPGQNKTTYYADRLVELLATDPKISRTAAATALGVPRDNGSFRNAWERVALARAGQTLPGAGNADPYKSPRLPLPRAYGTGEEPS